MFQFAGAPTTSYLKRRL